MKRKAFTLVEMLVVIGIIVLLIGILMPAINKAYQSAVRSRMAADLQTISLALEAYRSDFKDYPRDGSAIRSPKSPPFSIDNGTRGSHLLCWALIAPGPEAQDGYGGDSADPKSPAPGFRTTLKIGKNGRPQGEVHQPYIQPGQVKLGPLVNGAIPAGDDYANFIADRYGKPLLYFPAGLVKDPAHYCDNNINSTIAPADNLEAFQHNNDGKGLKRIRLMLGDLNGNGILDAGEQGVTAPYVLWSAGVDSIFGPEDVTPATAGRERTKCDDVLNVPIN